MASIYKRLGKGNWVYAWFDENGLRKTKSSGTTDYAAAKRIATKREADAIMKREGVVDGRLDAIQKQLLKPISEHLGHFVTSLRAKRASEVHQNETEGKIERICAFCKWKSLADISADGMNRFIEDLLRRNRSSRTVGAYVQAMKTFLRWAVKTGRLSVDPLASIAKPSPERDRRLVRRYLTHEEFGWLDVVTRQSEDLYGMSGWERALLYATAIQTGFRSSELRNLSRGKLMLHHQPPFILADGSKTKNGKSARQYLQPELASELKLMVESKVQGTPAFSMPEKSRVCKMFRRDLEAARVAWLESIKDEEKRREADEGDFLKTLNSEGEHLDFHALRHTTASWLILWRGHQDGAGGDAAFRYQLDDEPVWASLPWGGGGCGGADAESIRRGGEAGLV